GAERVLELCAAGIAAAVRVDDGQHGRVGLDRDLAGRVLDQGDGALGDPRGELLVPLAQVVPHEVAHGLPALVQPKLRLGGQDAADRLVDALLGDLAAAHGLDDDGDRELRVGRLEQDVGAGLDRAVHRAGALDAAGGAPYNCT